MIDLSVRPHRETSSSESAATATEDQGWVPNRSTVLIVNNIHYTVLLPSEKGRDWWCCWRSTSGWLDDGRDAAVCLEFPSVFHLSHHRCLQQLQW